MRDCLDRERCSCAQWMSLASVRPTDCALRRRRGSLRNSLRVLCGRVELLPRATPLLLANDCLELARGRGDDRGSTPSSSATSKSDDTVLGGARASYV